MSAKKKKREKKDKERDTAVGRKSIENFEQQNKGGDARSVD